MKKLLLFLLFTLFSFCGFSQSRYISETTKKIVFARNGGVCQCCGSSQILEYDHITPYSCGGKSDVSNIQLLCQKCNRSKSNSCYCKVHDKKVGVDCCDEKSINLNSSQSPNKSNSAVASQCRGRTQNGVRCKNKTTNSGGLCHVHQKLLISK